MGQPAANKPEKSYEDCGQNWISKTLISPTISRQHFYDVAVTKGTISSDLSFLKLLFEFKHSLKDESET